MLCTCSSEDDCVLSFDQSSFLSIRCWYGTKQACDSHYQLSSAAFCWPARLTRFMASNNFIIQGLSGLNLWIRTRLGALGSRRLQTLVRINYLFHCHYICWQSRYDHVSYTGKLILRMFSKIHERFTARVVEEITKRLLIFSEAEHPTGSCPIKIHFAGLGKLYLGTDENLIKHGPDALCEHDDAFWPGVIVFARLQGSISFSQWLYTGNQWQCAGLRWNRHWLLYKEGYDIALTAEPCYQRARRIETGSVGDCACRGISVVNL